MYLVMSVGGRSSAHFLLVAKYCVAPPPPLLLRLLLGYSHNLRIINAKVM